jgi:hypothetical protein
MQKALRSSTEKVSDSTLPISKKSLSYTIFRLAQNEREDHVHIAIRDYVFVDCAFVDYVFVDYAFISSSSNQSKSIIHDDLFLAKSSAGIFCMFP